VEKEWERGKKGEEGEEGEEGERKPSGVKAFLVKEL